MVKPFKYLCVMASALALTATLAAGAHSAERSASPRFSPVHLALLQYYSMPDWQFFENVLRRDAGWWISDRYLIGTLSRVDLVDGSMSSGTWSARGNYYYISGWDEKQYTGWVVFRFRNGNFDCLVFHNFPRTCRAPNG